MTTSTTKLITILATAAGLLTSGSVLAKGNGSNNNGKSSSNFKISFGTNKDCHKPCYDNHCYDHRCYSNYGCYTNCQLNSQAYEPFHSTYTVLPGDTFYTVSLKEYGTSGNSRSIAQFNRLADNSALVPGQQLMLPSISPNGILSVSRAPAGETNFNGFNNTFSSSPVTSPSFVAPTSFTAPVSTVKPVVEQPRPTIAVGSTLLVDGQTFGDKPGAAHVSVAGLALPVEVIEWSTSAVKIRLPKVEITTTTYGNIEVVRADGSLASRTAVELTKAVEPIALSK